MPLAGKPISAYRYRAPAPERWTPRRRADPRSPLAQFVVLSMLLHALAITLFGAPSGGSREGHALWGPLQVVLQAPRSEEAPLLRLDRGVELESGNVPRLSVRRAQRLARAHREEESAPRLRMAPLATPSAPMPAAAMPVVPPVAARPSAAPAAAAPAPATPAAAPEKVPFVMPKLLDRIPTAELKTDTLETFKVPAPTRVQAPPAPLPPATTGTPPPTAIPPPTVAPAPPPQPMPAPTPIAPPVAIAPVPLPTVERVRAEASVIPAPLEPVAAPKLEPLAAPPVLKPVPVESPLVPATPSAPPAERAPAEDNPIALPIIENVVPARVESAVKPAQLPPPLEQARALPSAPAQVVREKVPMPEPLAPTPAPASTPTPPTVDRAAPPVAEPASPPSPFRALPPAPGALANHGGEPPTLAPATPHLDLDAMRRRAGELAREGSGNTAVLPFPMPPIPKKKSKMELAIEKARKPDCRTAYQGLGLAAVVPLIANEFGEGTCRW